MASQGSPSDTKNISNMATWKPGAIGASLLCTWMLQQKPPDDFLITKGEVHAVREFLEEACKAADVKDPDKVVNMNPDCMRPADFMNLRGDATKAKQVLGWTPKVRFNELVMIMVEADLKLAAEESRQKKK